MQKYTDEQYQVLKPLIEGKRFSKTICPYCEVNERICFIRKDDFWVAFSSCGGINDILGVSSWHGMRGISGMTGTAIPLFPMSQTELENSRLAQQEEMYSPEFIPAVKSIVWKVLNDEPLRNKFCRGLDCTCNDPHIH